MNSVRYVLCQSVENEPEPRLYHILSMDEGSSSDVSRRLQRSHNRGSRKHFNTKYASILVSHRIYDPDNEV
jgi:hypothetical protein